MKIEEKIMRNFGKQFIAIPLVLLALILIFSITVISANTPISASATGVSEDETIEFDGSIVGQDLASYLTNSLAERGELIDDCSSNSIMSTTGVTEINHSNIIRNIGFFGNNTDGDCGMVAMGILLQFYEQLDTHYNYGEFVANVNWDYIQVPENPTNRWQERQDKQARALAFNDEMHVHTPTLLGPIGGIFGSPFSTTQAQHRIGFESYFSMRSPNVNVTPVTGGNNVATVRNLIDNNIPVLLTMINFNDSAEDGTDQNTEKGKPHVVVAYGYRIINGITHFLAHSGWWTNIFTGTYPTSSVPLGSARWFWPTGGFLEPFLYGYCYLDITPRYTTTPIPNTNNITITGMTYNHVGALNIPEILHGRTVTW
jgi:hypothetical protein